MTAMPVRQRFIEQRTIALLRATKQIAPPTDLDPVASRLGASVKRNVALPKGMRGHFDPDRFAVSLAAQSATAERFSLAHELGHAALDHGGACSYEGEPSVADVELDLDEADTGLDHEAEADDFAGRLLVPRAWLRAEIDSKGLAELAATFDVSSAVVLIAAQRYRLFARLQS